MTNNKILTALKNKHLKIEDQSFVFVGYIGLVNKTKMLAQVLLLSKIFMIVKHIIFYSTVMVLLCTKYF